MRLRRYTSLVLAEAFGQEVRDDHGNVWVIYSDGPAAVSGRRPTRGSDVSEYQQFKAMLERAGIGHGLRIDYNPAGNAVQVETHTADEGEFVVAEFWFDEDGVLKQVTCYPGEVG